MYYLCFIKAIRNQPQLTLNREKMKQYEILINGTRQEVVINSTSADRTRYIYFLNSIGVNFRMYEL